MMRPYSRGEKALPLQPFSWQLSADIDLEKKKKKERKSVKEGKLNGSTGANYNVMKARQKYPSYTHTHTPHLRCVLDCKQRKDLKVDRQKRCHFPLGRWRRSISPLQLRQTMRCVSSLIANRGSANHIGRFFFFLFLFAVTEAHKKVIMEEKWDLAQ